MGVCTQCGQVVKLRKDGKVSAHKRMGLRWGSSVAVRVRCGGASRNPAPTAFGLYGGRDK